MVKYKESIPKELFSTDGHYLGRPFDFDSRFVKRRIRLVKNILNFTGKEYSLLDIGCGNGASIFLMSPYMKECVGYDIIKAHEEEFVNYKTANKISNCRYETVDVTTGNPHDTFDRIISFDVIEHLSDEDAVSFYYDCLKEDGLMVITVPNKWWIFETHGARLPLLPWNRMPLFSWLPRPIHEKYANARIYTRKRIKKLLEKHGFRILNIQYITAPMDVLPDGKFKDWIIKHIFPSDTTRIPFKSTTIFIVADKKKNIEKDE